MTGHLSLPEELLTPCYIVAAFAEYSQLSMHDCSAPMMPDEGVLFWNSATSGGSRVRGCQLGHGDSLARAGMCCGTSFTGR
jgi:hypothetical protein